MSVRKKRGDFLAIIASVFIALVVTAALLFASEHKRKKDLQKLHKKVVKDARKDLIETTDVKVKEKEPAKNKHEASVSSGAPLGASVKIIPNDTSTAPLMRYNYDDDRSYDDYYDYYQRRPATAANNYANPAGYVKPAYTPTVASSPNYMNYMNMSNMNYSNMYNTGNMQSSYYPNNMYNSLYGANSLYGNTGYSQPKAPVNNSVSYTPPAPAVSNNTSYTPPQALPQAPPVANTVPTPPQTPPVANTVPTPPTAPINTTTVPTPKTPVSEPVSDNIVPFQPQTSGHKEAESIRLELEDDMKKPEVKPAETKPPEVKIIVIKPPEAPKQEVIKPVAPSSEQQQPENKNIIFDPVPGLFPKIFVDRFFKKRRVQVIMHGNSKS